MTAILKQEGGGFIYGFVSVQELFQAQAEIDSANNEVFEVRIRG